METLYSTKCYLKVIRPQHILLCAQDRISPKVPIQLPKCCEEVIHRIKYTLTNQLQHQQLSLNESIDVVMRTLSIIDKGIDIVKPCVRLDDCIGVNYITGTFNYTGTSTGDALTINGRLSLCITFDSIGASLCATINPLDMSVCVTDVGVYYEPTYIDSF